MPKNLKQHRGPFGTYCGNFFSVPQSGLGDMASLPVPNSLSLVLYIFNLECAQGGEGTYNFLQNKPGRAIRCFWSASLYHHMGFPG